MKLKKLSIDLENYCVLKELCGKLSKCSMLTYGSEYDLCNRRLSNLNINVCNILSNKT